MAVATRTKIRKARKEKTGYEDLLRELHHLAQANRATSVWTGKRFRGIKKDMNSACTNSKLLLAIIPMVG